MARSSSIWATAPLMWLLSYHHPVRAKTTLPRGHGRDVRSVWYSLIRKKKNSSKQEFSFYYSLHTLLETTEKLSAIYNRQIHVHTVGKNHLLNPVFLFFYSFHLKESIVLQKVPSSWVEKVPDSSYDCSTDCPCVLFSDPGQPLVPGHILERTWWAYFTVHGVLKEGVILVIQVTKYI